ncbi:WD repeat-containing protein 73 [Anguilla rostrata]|uniref:WD repeat-containing protein 73 n=1 Tax=Anguilla rostrata TaxID=7938 RepID=UPI0030CF0AE8
MEETSLEADIDDWFIESLKLYSDLHVFELQEPTQVIEWTAEKSVCVAGYSTTKTNEILELLLPQKLFAKGNQGLCSERDFKVGHGGFSEESVNCLKHIAGTRCVVTSGAPGSKLQVWQIGEDDSDTIKNTGCIEPKISSDKQCRIASGSAGAACVLHGSEFRDIQITELASGRVLYAMDSGSSDPVSGLQFVDGDTFLVCGERGDLCLCDTRAPSALQMGRPGDRGGGSFWNMGLKRGPSPPDAAASRTVAQLSSSGQVVVSDLRDSRGPLCRAQLNVPHKTPPCPDLVTVTWAPALSDHLAVSGFDGTVQIYDTADWGPELKETEPLFTHRGHVMSSGFEADADAALVTTHVWHPWKPRTVLSAATDGSLHVWDWVDDRAGNT